MFGLTQEEEYLFKKLSSPARIQDFLDTLPINKERNGDTCSSPRKALRRGTIHCIEGAFLAASILWYHGEKPLLLDLKSSAHDFDHVVALFKKNGLWGAISKTNHAVLRYREPVYKSVRELALSYFHEYFTHTGEKTLRSFSKPFNLRKFGTSWITSEDELWDIGAKLDDFPHIKIINDFSTKNLRRADKIEIQAGKLTEY